MAGTCLMTMLVLMVTSPPAGAPADNGTPLDMAPARPIWAEVGVAVGRYLAPMMPTQHLNISSVNDPALLELSMSQFAMQTRGAEGWSP